MRTLLALLFIAASATLLPAQQTPSPSPSATPQPLPPGPLLKRAPDPSQWDVSYTSPSKPAGDPPATPARTSTHGAKSKPAQHTSVVRYGAIRHIVTVDTDGVQTDTWCQGKNQINQRAGWARPLLSDGSDADDSLYVDYSQTDFPGFEWIAARNYMGVQKYAGRDCLVFQDKMVVRTGTDAPAKPNGVTLPDRVTAMPSDTGHVEVTLIACIDLDSRLPVTLRRGDEVANYQFGQPPDSAPELPNNVSAVLNGHARRLQELRSKPAKPF